MRSTTQSILPYTPFTAPSQGQSGADAFQQQLAARQNALQTAANDQIKTGGGFAHQHPYWAMGLGALGGAVLGARTGSPIGASVLGLLGSQIPGAIEKKRQAGIVSGYQSALQSLNSQAKDLQSLYTGRDEAAFGQGAANEIIAQHDNALNTGLAAPVLPHVAPSASDSNTGVATFLPPTTGQKGVTQDAQTEAYTPGQPLEGGTAQTTVQPEKVFQTPKTAFDIRGLSVSPGVVQSYLSGLQQTINHGYDTAHNMNRDPYLNAHDASTANLNNAQADRVETLTPLQAQSEQAKRDKLQADVQLIKEKIRLLPKEVQAKIAQMYASGQAHQAAAYANHELGKLRHRTNPNLRGGSSHATPLDQQYTAAVLRGDKKTQDAIKKTWETQGNSKGGAFVFPVAPAGGKGLLSDE